MRLAIPIRFKPKYILMYVLVIFVAQLMEGTNFPFAALTGIFTIIWAFAFNLAGGLAYPSGAFILSNGLLSVVVGLGVKVILLEPGQRNLEAPLSTMLCYVVGMTMFIPIVYFVRLIRPEKPLLSDFANLEDMKQGAIISLFLALIFVPLLGSTAVGDGGSIRSALLQMNQFPTLSLLLATGYEVRHSNGKSNMNWIVAVGLSIHLLLSLIYFGKGSVLNGLLAWILASAVYGYNFRKGQIVALAFGFFIMAYYLTPYSQYVRNRRSETGSVLENIATAEYYLSDLNMTRRLYLEQLDNKEISDDAHLYDERISLLDRLIIVAPDDQLIAYTNHDHVYGLQPTYAAYAAVVPRFLWPDKPTQGTGNVYAHELGILSDEDDSTGISFSPTADSYHQAKWFGLLVIMPIDLFLCFVMFDSFAGSARKSAFALLPIQVLFNDGAQAGLSQIVHEPFYGLAGLIFAVWCTKYAGPFVISVLRPRRNDPLAIARTTLEPVAATTSE